MCAVTHADDCIFLSIFKGCVGLKGRLCEALSRAQAPSNT